MRKGINEMETLISIVPLIVNALILVGVIHLIMRLLKRNCIQSIKREQEIQSDHAALKRRIEELEAEIEKLKK